MRGGGRGSRGRGNARYMMDGGDLNFRNWIYTYEWDGVWPGVCKVHDGSGGHGRAMNGDHTCTGV